MDKLIIPKRDPDECGEQSRVVKVNKKAMAYIKELCADTNRSQCDIASCLIEWAYEHVEVAETEVGDGND